MRSAESGPPPPSRPAQSCQVTPQRRLPAVCPCLCCPRTSPLHPVAVFQCPAICLCTEPRDPDTRQRRLLPGRGHVCVECGCGKRGRERQRLGTREVPVAGLCTSFVAGVCSLRFWVRKGVTRLTTAGSAQRKRASCWRGQWRAVRSPQAHSCNQGTRPRALPQEPPWNAPRAGPRGPVGGALQVGQWCGAGTALLMTLTPEAAPARRLQAARSRWDVCKTPAGLTCLKTAGMGRSLVTSMPVREGWYSWDPEQHFCSRGLHAAGAGTAFLESSSMSTAHSRAGGPRGC